MHRDSLGIDHQRDDQSGRIGDGAAGLCLQSSVTGFGTQPGIHLAVPQPISPQSSACLHLETVQSRWASQEPLDGVIQVE